MFKIRPFYIIGCQRSGTTLLRLILDSHPQVSCVDESSAYDLLQDPTHQYVPQKPGVKLVGYKIPRYTEQLDQPWVSDFGLPGQSPQFYAGDPLIFLVRDVRDVICSALNLRMEGSNWLEMHGMPILEYWVHQAEHSTVPYLQQLRHDYVRAKQSPYPIIAFGAVYWKMKNLAYFRYVSAGFPVLVVKYSKLTVTHRPILEKVTEFLDIPWSDLLLDHHLLPHSEVNEAGATTGGTDARRPISAVHVGQFNQQLSPEEVEVIWEIAGETMLKFGYKK